MNQSFTHKSNLNFHKVYFVYSTSKKFYYNTQIQRRLSKIMESLKTHKVTFSDSNIQVVKKSLRNQKQILAKYHQDIEEQERQEKIQKEKEAKFSKTSFRLMNSQQKRVQIIHQVVAEHWADQQANVNHCRIKDKYTPEQVLICKEKPKYIYYPPSCTGYDITYCRANNSIYIFGGVSCTSELSQGIQQYFYVYNKNQWKEVKPASMYSPMPRYGHTLTCLNNQLLLFGGVSEYKQKLRDRCFYADLWGYNTVKNNWRIIEVSGQSIKNRKSHAACIYNKYYILHGGIDDSEEVISEICWASCQEKKIRVRSKKLQGRFNHKIQICQNSQGRDYLFIFGGRNKDSEVINEFHVHSIYMHDSQLIIREASKISQVISPRQIPVMCILGNGLMIMGGIGQDNDAKQDGWYYDIEKQCLQLMDIKLDWKQLRGSKGVSINNKSIYLLPGSTSKKYKAVQIQKVQ